MANKKQAFIYKASTEQLELIQDDKLWIATISLDYR